MKRLIVLLIVVAGSLAAAAFAVPSNAAIVNGVAISQQQLNSDLNAIANSPDYQCFLNAEEAVGTQGETGLPAVDGAGQVAGSGSHPTVTTAFAANYLDTAIGHQLVLELAAKKHLHVTAQQVSAAHTALLDQITAILQDVSGSTFECGSASQTLTAKAILHSMPSSFVAATVHFDAVVSVFEEGVAGIGSSTADLEKYFVAHAAEFDSACFTVAEYSSKSAAQSAVAAVNAGTSFAQLAAEVTGGGPQGCDILYGVAAELPVGSDLGSLATNAVSSPIAEGSDYLLIQITSRSPTTFAQAKTEVQSAAQNAGASKARTVIDSAEKSAEISVDQRYGEWMPGEAEILPPTSPPSLAVLNPSVDNSGTATSPSIASSTGHNS